MSETESLTWIASHYDVPARRGREIRFAGALAVITGASGPHLKARMVETCRWAQAGQIVRLHPTWEVDYAATNPPPDNRDPAGCAGEESADV